MVKPMNWLRARLPWLKRKPPVVAVIRLSGVIASGGGTPLRPAMLNLASLAETIERAFAIKGVRAVALAINSPGGSPVQSALIAGRIRQLAGEKHVTVFAFAEDVAASGGYWLTLAADEIYADRSSIIGSIGVISSSFGFTGLMERIGVERRTHTKGEKKAFLDPFAPEKPDDVARLLEIQGEMHERFKDEVRARRGDRLNKAGTTELFSGEFWTGDRALALGLIDGIGDLRSVMRARYGKKVKLRLVGGESGWLRRRFGLAAPSFLAAGQAPLAGLADELIAAAEARALWARFGL